MAYGYGDGGGGPTRQMLEVQRRLHRPLPEIPTITGNRASEFYQRLEHSLNLDDPPFGTVSYILNTTGGH